MTQVVVYTVNLMGLTAPSFLTLRSSGYCAAAQNQRKTAQSRGKTVDYPLVSRRVAYRNFHGRNGDRSMTQGVTSKIAYGGISAGDFARAHTQPRPSLGSSHALLLLSCP
jgi:hypothetical protein